MQMSGMINYGPYLGKRVDLSTCIVLITPEFCDAQVSTAHLTKDFAGRLLSMGLGPHQYILGYFFVLADACFTQLGM